MAYVAISGELIDSVRRGIQSMARKELDTIGEVPKLQGTEPFIEQALWGPYAHLKGQMPKEWLRSCGAITLNIQFPDGAWQEAVSLNTAADAPPNFNSYNTPKVRLQQDDPAIASIVERVGNRNDANKRWRTVESQVINFLQKCRSLNEGLKLWPDLRMYIPKSYLDRVERKVERTKESSQAAETLKAIDTNQVVAAAVIARMSTGKTEEQN
jgi:hypothetical protein